MGSETKKVNKTPIHETVYRKIRNMVLFGDLTPGQAVTIQGLASDLGAGMTPVREAIRRLTAEGALEFQGNRRVCVPNLSLAQLDEIAFARLSIEPKLAEIASEKAKPSDISLIGAIDKTLNNAIEQGNIPAYLEQNYLFHKTLYSLSDARVLISISTALWLRVGPSLRVVCGRCGTQNLPDMHQEALTALENRDHQAVGRAISKDIQQGHDQIRSALMVGAELDLD